MKLTRAISMQRIVRENTWISCLVLRAPLSTPTFTDMIRNASSTLVLSFSRRYGNGLMTLMPSVSFYCTAWLARESRRLPVRLLMCSTHATVLEQASFFAGAAVILLVRPSSSPPSLFSYQRPHRIWEGISVKRWPRILTLHSRPRAISGRSLSFNRSLDWRVALPSRDGGYLC